MQRMTVTPPEPQRGLLIDPQLSRLSMNQAIPCPVELVRKVKLANTYSTSLAFQVRERLSRPLKLDEAFCLPQPPRRQARRC